MSGRDYHSGVSTAPLSQLRTGLQKALPDFLIAGAFLLVWIAPNVLGSLADWLPGEELVGNFVFMMFFEFFFVCAFGPIACLAYSRGSAKKKLVGLGFTLLFFAPFFVTLCRAAKGLWPILEILVLGCNKWLSGRQNSSRTLGMFHIIFRWATMAGLYMAVMASVFLFPIPVFGVESWMVGASGIPISGDMANEPHRVLAAGTIYFGCLGFYEFIFERVTSKKPV